MLSLRIATLVCLLCALLEGAALAEPQTVSFLDTQKFVGVWYQIARTPVWYEGENCACARQSFSLTRKAGVLGVFNSCNENNAGGDLKTTRGEAIVEDPATNAKFSLDYKSPIRATYWVIGIDPDYRYAVVTDAFGISLRILSRYSKFTDDFYKEAVAMAARQMDVSRLVPVDHKNCRYPR